MRSVGRVNEAYELHYAHGNKAFAEMLLGLGLNRSTISAKGVFLTDYYRRYLDFLSGYGVANIGHNHPAVKRAIVKAFEDELVFVDQTGLSLEAGLLLERLSDLTGGVLTRGFLSNSGTEAVEAAIKTARASTGKSMIITTEKAFHGKTMGSLSATAREKFRKPFAPLVSGFLRIPFNDLRALEEVLESYDGMVAGFLVEPVQGEGGVNVPDEGYLTKAGELCKKHKALLILDEVQTGMGRTGKMFAYQHEEGCEPDIICLAKALGGAMYPIGATLFKEKVYLNAYGDHYKALNHTSTFGGNTFACVAALTTIDILTGCGFYDLSPICNAKEKGEQLLSYLQALKNGFPSAIKEVRGKGLLIGIEFNPPSEEAAELDAMGIEGAAIMVAQRLFRKDGILTAFTMNNPNVLRIEPPLIIEDDHISSFILALGDILKNYHRIEEILQEEVY